MRHLTSVFVILVLASAAAQDANAQIQPPKSGGIIFPSDRLPLPSVGATKLAPDTLYVVQNPDEKLYLLLASPDTGVLSVTEKSGTVNIFAKFHDSDGQLVWREYTGKQIWIVQAKSTGEAELLFVPHGTPTAKDVVRKTIAVEMGQAPQPPPPKGAVKYLTFVFDLTSASQKVVNDPELRKWLSDGGIAVSALPGGDPVLRERGLEPTIKLVGVPCVVLQDAKGNVLTQSSMTSAEQVRKLVEQQR